MEALTYYTGGTNNHESRMTLRVEEKADSM